jgi:heat shock protein HslJ
MTDEQMDARLRGAGEAWRATDGPAVTVDAAQVETLTVPVARKPRRRTGLLASAAVVAAAILAGGAFLVANLGSDDGGPTSVQAGPITLTGTTWNLAHITDGNGHDVPVAGKAVLRIDKSDRLQGSDGCNSIGARVEIVGSTMHVPSMTMTEMQCSGGNIRTTVIEVHAVLSGDVAWSISGDKLTLSKPGAGTLLYQAVPERGTSTDPKDLIGVTWDLTTIETGSTGHTATGSPMLRIDPADTLGFTDGCNSNSAKVSVGAGTIDISDVGGTTAFCKQGNEVMAVLTGHVTWVISGDQLTITKDGVGALQYVAHPAPSGLSGTTWALRGLHDDGGSTSGALANMTIHFDPAGHITITHRCYVDRGDVQIGAETLDISKVHLQTAIPCTSPQDPNESQTNSTVDDVLTGRSTWTLQAKQLSITNGGTTLAFTPAGSSKQQQEPQLTGTAWNLIADTGITLTINSDGTYRLQTPCGSQGGSAAISGGTITFGDRHTIEDHSCPYDPRAQVLKVLDGIAKWSIADGQLTIGNAKGTLTFSAS